LGLKFFGTKILQKSTQNVDEIDNSLVVDQNGAKAVCLRAFMKALYYINEVYVVCM